PQTIDTALETYPPLDIIKIVNETVISRLQELGLAKPYNSNSMRVHYRSTRGVVPYTYRRDLTFEEFARFAEHNLDLPGVSVAARPSRKYLYDSLACHILGYVRLPDVKLVPEDVRRRFNFFVGDDFGISGIEKSMDQYLQGKPGKRIMLRSEKGKILGETAFEPPESGDDVYLTIDANIQYIAEEALRAVGRGAAVVLDPRNGEILAMASVPSFNPNKFIPTIEARHWKEYLANPTNPLNNRAIQGRAPGSTFKLPIALAGILAGAYKQYFTCYGGVQYGNKYMKCWIHEKGGMHGALALNEAIKRSCNAFFYQYGNETGIDNIQTVGKLLGLGEKTGIPVEGEQPGILPSPRWLKMNQPGYRWTSALTALVSIGQGATEATPLQMANIGATVANGGRVFRPRLVSRIVDAKGSIVEQGKPELRHDLTREGISREGIDVVRQGMWAVVNDWGGTAGRARSEKTVISGKTGTAQ
ncbi:MAG: penicillin-binding transpeptidase domain-containing protein, partial [Verrucomicrobiales bacterium]